MPPTGLADGRGKVSPYDAPAVALGHGVAQSPSSRHMSAAVVIDGRGRAGLRATAALHQLAGQYRSSGDIFGRVLVVPGTGVALGPSVLARLRRRNRAGIAAVAIEIRPFPISLTRDLLYGGMRGHFHLASRYHPKETLRLAKGNSFFMQKMSDHLYRPNPSNLFPISNIMFPRILVSPKRFSLSPAAGVRRRRPVSAMGTGERAEPENTRF